MNKQPDKHSGTNSRHRNAVGVALGLLLALALALMGQYLFHPQTIIPVPLPREMVWLLAALALLLGMVLAFWLAPRRSDSPGLAPHKLPMQNAEGQLPADTLAAASGPMAVVQHEPGTSAGVEASRIRGRTLEASPIAVLGVSLAIALVILAQLVFRGRLAANLAADQILFLGSALLVAGIVLFGASAPSPAPTFGRLGLLAPGTVTASSRLTRPWFLVWLGLSLAAYGFALGRLEGGGENLAVVLAWLFSMLALLVGTSRGLWRLGIPRRRTGQDSGGPAQAESSRFGSSGIVGRLRSPWLPLAVILIAALAMSLFRLTTLPYDLDGDFASHGLQARALATGAETGIFKLGWANIPMLGFVPSALTMKVFGTGLVGLNMAGVIEGLLILLGVFLLGRELFNPRVGVLAAALLSVSYVHVHFSRTSEYIDPIFFMVFGIYFLVLGLRRHHDWAFVLSGLLSALGAQMYYSGRIVIFVVALVFGYLLLFERARLRAQWQAIPLWAVAFLVGIGPAVVVYLRDWEGFLERSRAVFLLHPPVLEHLRDKYQVETLGAVVAEQAKRTLLMFHYYHDTSTQFGLIQPFLDSYVGAVFALGFGYALFHWRRFGLWLLLGWIALILLIGAFLTNNAPFWPRLVGLAAPAALLSAIALDALVAPLVAQTSQENAGVRAGRPWVELITWVALSAGVIVLGISNWQMYMDSKGDWATTRTRIGRYLAGTEPATQAYLVPDPYHYTDREFEFLAPERFVGNLTPDQVRSSHFAFRPQPEHGSSSGPAAKEQILVVLTGNHSDLLDVLQERFPAGEVLSYPDNDPGSIAFYAFSIPSGGS